MTIKAMSEVLGVSRDSIERVIRDLYPQKMRNGVTTRLNTQEVTEIKQVLVGHHNLRNIDKVKTLVAGQGASEVMTIKEISEALNISRDSIERVIQKLYPQKMKTGVTTMLSEQEVTEVKRELVRHHNFRDTAELRGAVTKQDKLETIAKAMGYLNDMLTELKIENEQLKLENVKAKPKAEYYDALVDKSAVTSFRDTSKELNIPERKFIEALSADKYIYRIQKRKLNAYAQFIQEGLFTVKEWQAADRTGVQTLITVKGKELFIKKYRHLQTPQKPLEPASR